MPALVGLLGVELTHTYEIRKEEAFLPIMISLLRVLSSDPTERLTFFACYMQNQ